MRFALLALGTAALACSVGCSSTPANQPDAAWVLNIDSGMSGTCNLVLATVMFGDVNATDPEKTVDNGAVVPDTASGAGGGSQMGATANVSCSVTGSATFAVSASASTSNGSESLTITIPSITTTASETSPATGSVSFADANSTAGSGNVYSGDACNFYFKQKPESVAAGKVWGAFTCAAVTDNSETPPAVCAISESFFVFENCSM